MIHEMIEHLLITIVIGLMCLGINATTWDGMIFCDIANKAQHFIYTRLTKIFKRKSNVKIICYMVCKPLFRCVICMASVWTIIFWIFMRFEFNVILMMLTVCGFNVVLRSIGQGVIQPYNKEDYE